MKKIMVDMDNVITNGVFLDLINEFLGEHHELNEFKNYYLQELIEDKKVEFWNWVKEKNFYENATLFEECYNVLKKLNEKYDVYIVTAYLWKEVMDVSGNNLKNKYYFLREQLPFIAPEKYIFTTNKNLMNFDIKIDDRIENLEGATVQLLFDAWHNRDLEEIDDIKQRIIRVHNWKEIESILLNEKS